MLPFTRIGASHHRDDRLGVAHVAHFVRHARLYEDEIPGSILDGLCQPFAELMADGALE